jgi:hypothetical protein
MADRIMVVAVKLQRNEREDRVRREQEKRIRQKVSRVRRAVSEERRGPFTFPRRDGTNALQHPSFARFGIQILCRRRSSAGLMASTYAKG